jgi:hypothetical protein
VASLTPLLLSGLLVTLGCGGALAVQGAVPLPEGTYTLRFCYLTCDDSTSVVGSGTLVHVRGDIRRQMTRGLADSLGGDLNFLLMPGEVPNACFQVSGQRHVGGQEFYVGIVRASLTTVTTWKQDSVSVGLYASPDASFHAVLWVDSSGVLHGVGHQSNWDGSKAPVTRVTGRRRGPANPRECIAGLAVR